MTLMVLVGAKEQRPKLIVHYVMIVRDLNGWTEITPENVDEIKSIESNRVIICGSNSIGYMYPLTLLSLECSLESIADYGSYYYFVLPELKIE